MPVYLTVKSITNFFFSVLERVLEMDKTFFCGLCQIEISLQFLSYRHISSNCAHTILYIRLKIAWKSVIWAVCLFFIQLMGIYLQSVMTFLSQCVSRPSQIELLVLYCICDPGAKMKAKLIHLCPLNKLSFKIRTLHNGNIVGSHDRVFVFLKRIQTIIWLVYG